MVLLTNLSQCSVLSPIYSAVYRLLLLLPIVLSAHVRDSVFYSPRIIVLRLSTEKKSCVEV